MILSVDDGDGVGFNPGQIVCCGSNTWPLVLSIFFALKQVDPFGQTMRLKSSPPKSPISARAKNRASRPKRHRSPRLTG